MENPVRALRESIGLSRDGMALLTDTTHNVLSELENGRYHQVPARLIIKLEEAGLDGVELARKYRLWREVRSQELLARAQAVYGGGSAQ